MPDRLNRGDLAPPFHLPDQDGRSVGLDGFRGRRLVVYFYPKDDTPGCTKEACQFNEALAGLRELNVDVVGISGDGGASHRRFRNKYGLEFALLSDPDHRVAEAYGAYGAKTMYGKPVTGVIRSTFLVDEEGRIARAWYGVKADGHAARVLEELSQPAP